MRKSYLILSAILLVSVAIVGFKNTAQEKQYEYATIKVQEQYGKGISSLAVIYPDGEKEIVQLEKMDTRDKIFDNTIKISAKVNELGRSGYKLITQSSFSTTVNVHLTTYVFIKE